MRSIVLLASLCLAAAACNGGGGGGGGGRDPVTLLLPLADVPISIHGEDGAVRERVVTDATGSLELDVPNGGSFAIYYLYDDLYLSVAHVIDPPAGSEWSFPLAEPTPQATPPMPHTLTVTLNPVGAGANGGRVTGQCSNAGGSGLLTFPVPVACGLTSTDLVAISMNGNVRVGWGTASNITVMPGGASSLTIDASNPAFDTASFTVTSIPAAFESGVSLSAYTGPDLIDIGDFSDLPPPGPSTVTASGLVPQGLTTRARAYYFVQNDISQGIGDSFSEDRWGPSLAAVSTTASVPAFPLARVVFAIPDTTDPLRPVITWTRGGGSAGTYGAAQISGNNSSAEQVSHYLLFDPAHDPELRLPEVPETEAAYRLTSFSDYGVSFGDDADPAAMLVRYLPDQIPPPVDGVTHSASGYFIP